MELRVKDVAKSKGLTLQDVCKRMNISYVNFNQKLNRSPNTEFIQQIADAIGCPVFEIIVADKHTHHCYDENGEWRGVVRNP